MDNKSEYIPGDLVMTNGVPLGTVQNVVYRVTSSDPSTTLKLGDGTVLEGVVCLENIEGAEFGDKGYLSGDCCAWVKDIEPIPLTTKSIEKNGWKNDGIYFTNRRIPRIKLCTDKEGSKWAVIINNDIMGGYIYYVHWLQHILYAFRIEGEMEV